MSDKINVFEVHDHIWEKVSADLNLTKSALDKDVVEIQKWLETQPHLPKLLDSHCIRNFLILTKGSIEVTKQKIDYYYTARSKIDFFDRLSPNNGYYKPFTDIFYVVPYPYLTKEMYRPCYLKIKNESLLDSFEPLHLAKKSFCMQEIRLREDVMLGEIFVLDGKGLTLVAVLKVTPTALYQWIILIYQKMFSFRFKQVYLINMPYFVSTLVNVVKTLVKPKVFERIHFCKDVKEIKRTIPANLIPPEFGGEGFSLNDLEDAVTMKFKQYENLFDRLDKIKVNENLRPEKLKNEDNVMYGNFKKLELD